MGTIWKKILHLVRPRRFEAELEEELRFHRHMLEADSAHPAAFGNATLALEDSRGQWTFGWLESLRQDMLYALRGFRRAPLFALTVIGTIGLALGLNTTLFTVFNAYVLRPVSIRDPHGLYDLDWVLKRGGRRFSWQEFEDLQRTRTGFSESAAYNNLIARVNAYPLFGHLVSGNYFPLLGVDAAMGRLITPDDASAPGAGPVVVLSYAAWKNKFGADPNLLGSKVIIHGQPLEVIGVTRPEFSGIDQVTPDFWIPTTMEAQVSGEGVPASHRPAEDVAIIGRLPAGTTPQQVQAQVTAWGQRITADRPEAQRALSVLVKSRATMIPLNQEVLAVFLPLLAAFVLVLLIACANVANMMLARGLARQREIGIRLSLGAARSRLIRQLLTESLLLALPAALAGFLISGLTLRWGQELMFNTLPAEFARLIRVTDLAPDARVFAFILLASVLSTLAFGLAPALQATRRGLVQASRGDFSADLRPARLRNALVVSQVTVCALLLIVTGILLRTGRDVATRDVRMDMRAVIDVRMPSRFQVKAAAMLRELPMVEAVAPTWQAPLYGGWRSVLADPSGSNARFWAGYNLVAPEYFSVLRIPILRGRNFTYDEARSEAAVAIVSEATAQRFWPGRDALGESIDLPPNPNRGGSLYPPELPHAHSVRVIGIARDVMGGWIGDGIDATLIYFPVTENRSGLGSMLLRLKGDPATSRREIEAALNRVVPGAADQINPLDQVLAVQIYPFRVGFWISSFLGGLALVLTISGMYGVMAYLVGQRSKEIGIRMALGASATGIVRMVLSQSLRLTLTGLALGVAAALALSNLLAKQITVIALLDQFAYAGGIAVVLAAALLASLVPSRRAVKVDPVSALRCD
jgi:predicted permease